MISQDELSRILYQLGEENFPHGVVAPPIFPSSNFSFQTIQDFREAIADEKNKPIYSRGNNPTVRLLEKKVAALQGTEDALFFGSGSAAVAAAVLSVLRSGDHVIFVAHSYSWTHKLITQTLKRFGVTYTIVDGYTVQSFEHAYRPDTMLVILESPTSLSFRLQDLKSSIAWAKEKGLTVLCDNSYGSPLNRKPAEFGADLICHSATKFIGGHSDVVAGVVCGSSSHIRSIFYGEYMTFGATLPAEQAWLLIRSLRTISQRLKASAECASIVVDFLKSHPGVEKVQWPFDPDNDQYTIALQQFDQVIPMFSIWLRTESEAQIIRFCESLRVFRMAVSWGGYESLILPAIIFTDTPHPRNMIRIYCGLEGSNLLIRDLEGAFEASGLNA
jgi:cystathionine beta-lyase/cystathionine gamma-synthase